VNGGDDMGAECPNGHGRQRIVQNITVDGNAPRRAEDIIARKLACGCVLQSGPFEAFQEAVGKVKEWKARQIMRISGEATARMGAAYAEFVQDKGDANAE